MRLIPYNEALARVLSLAPAPSEEQVNLSDAFGRVLSRAVAAQCDLPPFDNAAVDGYALRDGDAGGVTEYSVVAETRAGDRAWGGLWLSGQAIRVFTGAPLPPDTGAVVMQEDARVATDHVAFAVPPVPGAHIRRQGEERRRGEVVLPASHVLGPASIAAAAAAGVGRLPVVVPPSLGILATGSELATPGEPLDEGQVYEANAHALVSAALNLGIRGPEVSRIGDDPARTTEAVERLAESADVLVATGGVSVGSYDCVRPALAKAGFETVLWGVRMKPGKPVYVGVRDKPRQTVCFGLPGNPLSTLVTWSVFVRPFLRAWHGLPGDLERFTVRCAEPIRRKPGRLEFVPAKFVTSARDAVRPLAGRASHMLGAAAAADALIVLEEDTAEAREGESVVVTPWDWELA